MSYDNHNTVDRLIELLEEKGYRISFGNGWNARELQDGEGDDFFADSPELKEGKEEDFDPNLNGYWFTWSHPSGGDVEVGPTCGNYAEVWATAMEHFFEDAEIPMDKGDESPHALDERELGTVLAALRSYQEQGYGDMHKLPVHLADIAVNGAENRVPLDDNEIDDLCVRLNSLQSHD
jgi:hypothetical protein